MGLHVYRKSNDFQSQEAKNVYDVKSDRKVDIKCIENGKTKQSIVLNGDKASINAGQDRVANFSDDKYSVFLQIATTEERTANAKLSQGKSSYLDSNRAEHQVDSYKLTMKDLQLAAKQGVKGAKVETTDASKGIYTVKLNNGEVIKFDFQTDAEKAAEDKANAQKKAKAAAKTQTSAPQKKEPSILDKILSIF